MNEEIKAILGNGINVCDNDVPVAHFKYEGKSKRFITWTLLGETPVFSANDEQMFSVCTLDIDIFSESNYLDMIKEIKKIMKNNEWVWVEDSPEMYEDDTGLYHRTCTFEKERVL